MGALTTNYAATDDFGGVHSYHAPVSQVNTVSAPGFVKTVASPVQTNAYTKVSTSTYGVLPYAHHKVDPYNAPSSTVSYTGPGVHKTVSYTSPTLVHKSSYTGPVFPAVAYTAPVVHDDVYGVPSIVHVAPVVHYRLSNPGFTKTFQTPFHSTIESNQVVPQAQKHINLGLHL